MEGARIAYEIASSQLKSQKEDLRNIRNQASFGAVITGLIGSVFAKMLSPGDFKILSVEPDFLWFSLEFWILIVAFAGSITFAILVMSSWKKCTFELSPKFVLEMKSSGKEVDAIYSRLAKDADDFFDQNEKVIDEVKSQLWWSLLLSWCQIPAWLLLIY